MTDQTTRAAVEAVWRLESTRLIAGLVGVVRDLAIAEDLAQDALLAALDQWPHEGVPPNPGAWLMTVAKRRALDMFRRSERRQQIYATVGRSIPMHLDVDMTDAVDRVEDDVLRLMFICCHPALTPEAQTTLTLKMIAGLSSREIARAYLTSESTIAQRLVRAKRTLTAAGAALEEPKGAEREERLTAVLAAVYLLFNEGYSATAGDMWTRPLLCKEALRLGRILTAVSPGEPEVFGLTALMEFQSSRLQARTRPDGTPILLDEQDRSTWDYAHIRRGLAALDQAAAGGNPGAYVLQAAIAAHHARSASAGETDWAAIAVLYEQLGRVSPSPIVELNRAVAVARAHGPQAGLAVLDRIGDAPALRGYHLLPAVRADFLAALGRTDEAEAELLRAAQMTANEQERAMLRTRAERLGENK
ncbi:sigma-70 family RNA polymerase sigma factor [Hoyosella sp. YIM 151337]|uniref:RNA polymerase sigma factor n=1 Tax=Hoyosella sp. YIM 151337 TaxID=2992742 RepID=UPI0022367582|nr:sigma-70 family RNA polymerase sigma factor [Hoyosella sp. YIM 151337]MCW4354313.1 sigma-70 family RNA polymerase sigma factor [Hoyosella sp. YIM 151337]